MTDHDLLLFLFCLNIYTAPNAFMVSVVEKETDNIILNFRH